MNKLKKILAVSALFAVTLMASNAYSALTISGLSHENAGSEKKAYLSIAFDATYPTGGEALSLPAIGLTQINKVNITNTDGYKFDFVSSTNKIKVYAGGTSAETANGTDLSALTGVRLGVSGH